MNTLPFSLVWLYCLCQCPLWIIHVKTCISFWR